MNSLQFRRPYQPPAHDKGLIREGFGVVIPLPASVLPPHRPVLVCLLTCRLRRGSKTVGLQDSPKRVQKMTEYVREDLIVSLAVGTYIVAVFRS